MRFAHLLPESQTLAVHVFWFLLWTEGQDRDQATSAGRCHNGNACPILSRLDCLWITDPTRVQIRTSGQDDAPSMHNLCGLGKGHGELSTYFEDRGLVFLSICAGVIDTIRTIHAECQEQKLSRDFGQHPKGDLWTFSNSRACSVQTWYRCSLFLSCDFFIAQCQPQDSDCMFL